MQPFDDDAPFLFTPGGNSQLDESLPSTISPQNEAAWIKAGPSDNGKGLALFPDERTPMVMRKDIRDGYIAFANDPANDADALYDYAIRHGVGPLSGDSDACKASFQQALRQSVAVREKGGHFGNIASLNRPPLITDPSDGRPGTFARGLADPTNMLDELGGIVDTLGGSAGRRNIWSDNERFGDLLWENIDKNRAILNHDERYYPGTRFAGQLVGGTMIPGFEMEGAALSAARTALQNGATKAAARATARNAILTRLVGQEAAKGFISGFGKGEGGPSIRS